MVEELISYTSQCASAGYESGCASAFKDIGDGYLRGGAYGR